MGTVMDIIDEEIEGQKGKKFNASQPALGELGKGMGLIL